jgi:glucan phosphoethanolaminetransferase (alkaline phosphatase superfamily)
MLGWLIILGVSIIVLIVCIILKMKDGYMSEWELGILISGLFVLCCVVAIMGMFFTVKEEVKTFELYQEMIEASYSEDETELNYAMNIQVIELNTWLAEARACEETYGIFSFYKGKLDDLEYVEIGD